MVEDVPSDRGRQLCGARDSAAVKNFSEQKPQGDDGLQSAPHESPVPIGRPEPATSASAAIVEEDSDYDAASIDMIYGAKHLIMIFKPVCVCMLFVVIVVSTLDFFHQDPRKIEPILYAPFRESPDQPVPERLWRSIANALIFLCFVMVFTTLAVILYKCRCTKLIYTWLVVTFFIMTVFTVQFLFTGFLGKLNIAFDYISAAVLLWNFAVLAMMAIFWKAPLIIQQMYLINTGATCAMLMIRLLPEWSTWLILGVIAMWDVVAVLCPFGPLKIMVETAQRRNEGLLPGLIYSSTVVYLINMANNEVRAGDGSRTNNPSRLQRPRAINQEEQRRGTTKRERTIAAARQARHREARSTQTESDDVRTWHTRPNAPSIPMARVHATTTTDTDKIKVRRVVATEEIDASGSLPSGLHGRNNYTFQEELSDSDLSEDDETDGAKLGLGDFVFYSILVGSAAVTPFQSGTQHYGEWTTVLSCFVAILVGLALTLFILAIVQKALPALPISIALGLFFYFVTSIIILPFVSTLNWHQIYI